MLLQLSLYCTLSYVPFVSFLESRQSNLSYPEAKSEHRQTSKIDCLAKTING